MTPASIAVTFNRRLDPVPELVDEKDFDLLGSFFGALDASFAASSDFLSAKDFDRLGSFFGALDVSLDAFFTAASDFLSEKDLDLLGSLFGALDASLAASSDFLSDLYGSSSVAPSGSNWFLRGGGQLDLLECLPVLASFDDDLFPSRLFLLELFKVPRSLLLERLFDECLSVTPGSVAVALDFFSTPPFLSSPPETGNSSALNESASPKDSSSTELSQNDMSEWRLWQFLLIWSLVVLTLLKPISSLLKWELKATLRFLLLRDLRRCDDDDFRTFANGPSPCTD